MPLLSATWTRYFVVMFVCLLLASCGGDDGGGYGGYGDYYSAGEISFIDDLKTNTDVSDDLLHLMFVDVDSKETTPADFAQGKNVVLVMTRGNTEPICPYCSTQVSRLIANYDEFVSRGAEVLVVYPIEHKEDSARLEAFLANSKGRLRDPNQPVPFPILLDVELKAVDRLGIRRNLSKPATYILDSAGKVRFAYVGDRLDDRPSVKAMLAELDKL